MPPAPVVAAYSRLTNEWSLLKQQRSFRAAIRPILNICWMVLLVAYQVLCLLFRAVISGLVVIAPVILGGILGYFCFFHGSSGTGMFFKAFLLSDIQAAEAAARALMAFGASSFVSVVFLAWRRRTDFIMAFQAAWRWMWLGRMEETVGLVKAMTRQLAVYAGLFFALFIVLGQAKGKVQEPSPTVTVVPNATGQVLNISLASVLSVIEVRTENLQTQLTDLQTAIGARSGVVVYLDKSTGTVNDQREQFDLIYVALFDNASFSEDSSRGRTLNSAEKNRLVNFANSLRQIAKTKPNWGNEADRMRVEVCGFASDAPKSKKPEEKDILNNKIANDRAQSVYDLLNDVFKDVIKDAAVDLRKPKVWGKPIQMQENRHFDDAPIQLRQQETALAEAPNRRVEIRVTLPPGLQFRVSKDIPESHMPQL